MVAGSIPARGTINPSARSPVWRLAPIAVFRSPFPVGGTRPNVASMSDPKNTPEPEVTAPEEVDLDSGTDQDGTPVENPSG